MWLNMSCVSLQTFLLCLLFKVFLSPSHDSYFAGPSALPLFAVAENNRRRLDVELLSQFFKILLPSSLVEDVEDTVSLPAALQGPGAQSRQQRPEATRKRWYGEKQLALTYEEEARHENSLLFYTVLFEQADRSSWKSTGKFTMIDWGIINDLQRFPVMPTWQLREITPLFLLYYLFYHLWSWKHKKSHLSFFSLKDHLYMTWIPYIKVKTQWDFIE